MIAPSPLAALTQEPVEAYHAQRRDYLSSHALADFRACPQLYRQKQLGLIPDEETPALLLGSATHALALEGRDAYEREFVVGGPINERTGRPFGRDTKAFAEWAAVIQRPVLSVDQAELVEAMAAAVQAHPEVAQLLAEGMAEGVLRTTYAGIACQGRFDWVNPNAGIVDLKTCEDLTWFEVSARRFGYAHQLAFYRDLLRTATGADLPVYLVGVERRAPYRVGVWRISDQVLDIASSENRAAIERLLLCQSTDRWPTGYESIRIFDTI